MIPLRPWGRRGRGEVGVAASERGTAHLTLPVADTTGPLPLPPPAGGEGEFGSSLVWQRKLCDPRRLDRSRSKAALARAESVPYPVAVGALAADHGIPADLAAAAFAQALAMSLVSAAVRLIPLGQSAGLRVVAALEPIVALLVERTNGAGLDDLGGCCFRADIAALRHETQRTRLFRT